MPRDLADYSFTIGFGRKIDWPPLAKNLEQQGDDVPIVRIAVRGQSEWRLRSGVSRLGIRGKQP